jgi:hypothetical protein
MTNLLVETIEDITKSGHTVWDIIFIGSLESGYSCSWEQFEKLANFKYCSGYGAAAVASDLVIAFSDGAHMWRDEYDGSEWWMYQAPIKIPKETRPTKTLGGDNYMWKDLREMNEGDEDGYRKQSTKTH